MSPVESLAESPVEVIALEKVLQEIDRLSLADQMQVLEHLVKQVKRSVMPPVEVAKKKRKISDFIGIVQSPMLGEDAQEWVSRTRRDGDEDRERVLRGEG